ncbi:MAG TPA: FAD-dependent oxidoreductase [Gemmatimonadaceae bacterium]|nr:FAD-dependent oxidoreductase [Gemmatimonadaceae bacterium]
MDLVSNSPFWPINDGLIATYPRLDRNATCRVAVLGGGITGALVAHCLTEAGIDAIVLDKRDVGTGSTAASTALLQYEIDTSLADLTEMRGVDQAARAYLACRDAINGLQQLAARLPGDFGFARKKSLYLASKKKDRKLLRKEWEMRRALGLEVDWLEEFDIAERFAFRRPAALLSHDAAHVDAYAFAHALLADAASRGLRVFDRTDVAAIEPTSVGVTLRTADGCVVRADKLVFATGYETHAFLEHPVARLVSTFAVVSEPHEALNGWGEDRCLIWEHARPYLYLRTTEDGRVIVGGEDEGFRDPRRRDRLIPRKAERLVARFRDLFPDIIFEPAFAWAGTFGETDDGLAYIGEHPDWPHAYFALGYGGNGITFSFLAAEIIRDALLGRRNDSADLFRFNRCD